MKDIGVKIITTSCSPRLIALVATCVVDVMTGREVDIMVLEYTIKLSGQHGR